MGALAGARRGVLHPRLRAHLLRSVARKKGNQTRADAHRKQLEGGCRVAPGTDEAQRQKELTKQALEQSAGRLEQRVRAELDWKARLRRDGPRYAAIAGGAVLLIGTLV